jgi:RNA polymerase sigma factor (sigma-70 family)
MSSLRDLSAAGSRRARFQALYEENYHRVLGYALRRIGAEDAADVVAETFLVAWRRLDEVPPGDAARLWLYGTARRVLANLLRGKRRRERLEERLRTHVMRTTELGAAHELEAAAVAFAGLRADEREVLALVAWEGLDAGEIGQVLGCSRNAARIRIHRARRRFARELTRAGSPKRNPVGGHVTEAHD